MIDIDSIKSAKYFTDSMSDKDYCINIEDDNGKHSVPIDTTNTDYQAIQEWVADGNTIEESD
tara:strand:+ start:241 stop:426 length:186 start_codon:yes stop_codon:yes gene_type:complete